MTSPCTSASHQTLCPIKCSLESEASRPLNRCWSCSSNWSLVHRVSIFRTANGTVHYIGDGNDSDSVNMLFIGAKEVWFHMHTWSAPVQRHDRAEQWSRSYSWIRADHKTIQHIWIFYSDMDEIVDVIRCQMQLYQAQRLWPKMRYEH